MTKSRIALIVSMMFAAPAAVVALEQSTTLEAAPPSEQTELQAAAIPAPESTSPPETTLVVTETVVVAEAPAAPAPRMNTSAMPQQWTNNSFPKSVGPEDYDRPMLAKQAAYFDRQDRSQMIARHDAFPGAAYEDRAPLPATVAYFDRGEQQRFASTRTAPRAEVQARTSQEAAQAGSAEVAMAETSAIR